MLISKFLVMQLDAIKHLHISLYMLNFSKNWASNKGKLKDNEKISGKHFPRKKQKLPSLKYIDPINFLSYAQLVKLE